MRTLTARQLRDLLRRDRDLLLINVLKEEAFEKSRIPGSHNIPVGRDGFAEEVLRLAGRKDRPITVYCANAACDASPKAARRLEEAGFTDVYDFEDGMRGWIAAGFEVERASRAAAR